MWLKVTYRRRQGKMQDQGVLRSMQMPDGVRVVAESLEVGAVWRWAIAGAMQGKNFDGYTRIAGQLFHICITGWPPAISVELVLN